MHRLHLRHELAAPAFRLLAASLALAVVSTVSPHARADDTAGACADAYEQAQRSRQSGHLRAALSSAIACAKESCPAILRRECTEWIAPIRASLPSIAVRVRGKDGCDRTEASVDIDGEVVATSANGAVLDVDPGPRTVKVTIDGAAPHEERIVVVQGEHGRSIVASFAPRDVVCGAPPKVASAIAPDRASAGVTTSRPIPPLAFVGAGLGIVALGVSGGFGLAAFSKKSDLEGCRPACSPSDTDAMRTSFTISDVALGVGVVSLGLAAVLYLTRPEIREAR